MKRLLLLFLLAAGLVFGQTEVNAQRHTTIIGSYKPADADAIAFLDSAGISDAGIRSAVNILVTELKDNSLWSKMYAMWPMVGGSATSHKWNLIDPQDTDAAFRLVFSGGWTHSASGALPNGTNAYADTKFNPNSEVGSGTFGMGYYTSTPQSSIASLETLFGVNNTGNTEFAQLWRNTSPGSLGRIRGATGASYVGTLDGGLFSVQRISSTDLQLYHAGSSLVTETTSSAGNLPNFSIYIAARNLNGSSTLNYAVSNCQFAFFSQGLTSGEMSTLTTILQNFQTALGR